MPSTASRFMLTAALGVACAESACTNSTSPTPTSNPNSITNPNSDPNSATYRTVDSTDCASPRVCEMGGTYDASQGACTFLPEATGTLCSMGAGVCASGDSCYSGFCLPTSYTYCTSLDACGVPAACDPNSGCPTASSGSCATKPVRIPLSGCSSNNYWADVSLGGSQTFSLIVDSGSSTLAVVAGCNNCTGSTPEYIPGSTAQNENVGTAALYGDESGWRGEAYRDVVGLPGLASPVPMDFAAISAQTSFFEASNCVIDVDVANSYQGILGLAQSQLAVSGTEAFMDKLNAATALPEVFAVQLCNQGGNLWLGGFDPAYATQTPLWTPMDVTSVYMAINIDDLKLDGNSLGYSQAAFGSAVVDTGTSLFVLPTTIYNALVARITSNATYGSYFPAGFFSSASYKCIPISATPAQLDAQLPPLALTFPVTGSRSATFTVNVPATASYLVAYQTQAGTHYYCPGIEAGSQTIFGSAVMHDLLLIFDIQSQQIGFAPQAGCAE